MTEPPPAPLPIVLVHGLGQGPLAWQDVISALAVDNGLGARPYLAPWISGLRPKTERFEFDAAVGDFARQVDLGVGPDRPVVLCGTSLGAQLATRYAAQYPSRVAGLVLVGGQVRPPKLAMSLQAKALRLVPKARFEALGVSKKRTLGVLDTVARIDLGDDLPQIAAPTVVVCGSRDRPNVAAARELVQGIAQAQLHLVAKGGHALNTERPGDLAAVIAGLVGILEGRPTPDEGA